MALFSTARTTQFFPWIPTTVDPLRTASMEYSTCNKCPSGLNTVMARSYDILIIIQSAFLSFVFLQLIICCYCLCCCLFLQSMLAVELICRRTLIEQETRWWQGNVRMLLSMVDFFWHHLLASSTVASRIGMLVANGSSISRDDLGQVFFATGFLGSLSNPNEKVRSKYLIHSTNW